jgi:hypothetical protein
VEELIVNDDPEHQWIDRIRPTRASNQARQAAFSRLTGELQRLIGVKVRETLPRFEVLPFLFCTFLYRFCHVS